METLYRLCSFGSFQAGPPTENNDFEITDEQAEDIDYSDSDDSEAEERVPEIVSEQRKDDTPCITTPNEINAPTDDSRSPREDLNSNRNRDGAIVKEERLNELLTLLDDALNLQKAQNERLSAIITTLQESTILLNKSIQAINDDISQSVTNISDASDKFPINLSEKCNAEYEKIFNNAAENFRQLQTAINVWTKKFASNKTSEGHIIFYSSIICPVLLIILVISHLLIR